MPEERFTGLGALEALAKNDRPSATFAERASEATFAPSEVAEEVDTPPGGGKPDIALLLAGISDAFQVNFMDKEGGQTKALQATRDAVKRLDLEQQRLKAQREEAASDRRARKEALKTTEAGLGGRQKVGIDAKAEADELEFDRKLELQERAATLEKSVKLASIRGDAKARRATRLFDDMRDLTAFGLVLPEDLTDMDAIVGDPEKMNRFLDATAGPRNARIMQDIDNKTRERYEEAWAASGAFISGIVAGDFGPDPLTGKFGPIEGTSMAEKAKLHIGTTDPSQITDEDMNEFVEQQIAQAMHAQPEFALAMHSMDPRMKEMKTADLRNEIERVYLKQASDHFATMQLAGALAKEEQDRKRGRLLDFVVKAAMAGGLSPSVR